MAKQQSKFSNKKQYLLIGIFGFLILVLVTYAIVHKPNSSKKSFEQLKSDCQNRHKDDTRQYIRDPCGDSLIMDQYNEQFKNE